MIDLSFVLGLALGTIVTGFCAIGSFNRGFDSVRRRSWTVEHVARKRAVVASRAHNSTEKNSAQRLHRTAS
jgi:hypothetical protein